MVLLPTEAVCLQTKYSILSLLVRIGKQDKIESLLLFLWINSKNLINSFFSIDIDKNDLNKPDGWSFYTLSYTDVCLPKLKLLQATRINLGLSAGVFSAQEQIPN